MSDYKLTTTLPFSEQTSTHRWPMWHDIEDSLIALGLASRGYRLTPQAWGPTPIMAKGYGYGVFTCEAKQPVAKGRASPHRLKVLCTCGNFIFFGKMQQHHRACRAKTAGRS